MLEGVRKQKIFIVMKIKTQDGQEVNVASQSLAGTALGFGIGGTVLGLMNGNNGCGNNGLLGNLFGGNNNNCCGCPVNTKELNYAIQLAACQGREYALHTAREEDAKIFNEARRSDEKIANVVKEVTDGLIKTGVAVAENKKEIECLKIAVERNREEARNYTDNRVTQEAQLRKAADDNLASWVNSELCHKIDGHLTINGNDICWHKCSPVMEQCSCGSASNPFNVVEVKPAK